MNLKKLDEKDVVFIDQPWTDEDRKLFTAFLQKRKLKKEVKQAKLHANTAKKTA